VVPPVHTSTPRHSNMKELFPADKALLGHIRSEALRVFGDRAKAEKWLRSPNTMLGGVPLQLIASASGLRLVEEELVRIDFGDFA